MITRNALTKKLIQLKNLMFSYLNRSCQGEKLSAPSHITGIINFINTLYNGYIDELEAIVKLQDK